MKIFKLSMILIMLMAINLSCEKEGPQGPQGPQGPAGPSGPGAKTYNFNLTFNAGDTWKSYSGITDYNADDVIIVYIYSNIYSGQYFWCQLPVIYGNVNYWPEFSDETGFLFINTTWADGSSGSPWSSSYTFGFKAVLIHSSVYSKYPDINYSNFEEVAKVFNLQ